MANIAKSVKVVHNPDGTSKMFVGEDEFPWFTKRGSRKVEPYEYDDGEQCDRFKWVTVTMLVDGPVEL